MAADKKYIVDVTDPSNGVTKHKSSNLNADEVQDLLVGFGNPSLEDYNHSEGWQIYSVDKYPDCCVNVCEQ